MVMNVMSSVALFVALSFGQQAATPPVQSPPPQSTTPVAIPRTPDFVILKPNGAPLGQQPPAQPKPQPSPAVSPERYAIGAAHTLSSPVVAEPDLTAKYRVDPDGSITMPYIGRQTAAGMTVADLQNKITTLLKDGYLQNPQVLIAVDVYKARSVLVVGEVRSPGKVQLTGLTMSLLEALALAGAPTSAAANEVIVVHTAKPGETAKEITVNRR